MYWANLISSKHTILIYILTHLVGSWSPHIEHNFPNYGHANLKQIRCLVYILGHRNLCF